MVIKGPKACGKTATATRQARTVLRLDEDSAARALILNAPDLLFDNPAPILFDEWQVPTAMRSMTSSSSVTADGVRVK